MGLFLKYGDLILGEIIPQTASIKTKELKGLLIPTDNYFKYRSQIIKHNETFNNYNSSNLIDNALDKMLKNKYKDLKTLISEFKIILNDYEITSSKSEVQIIDNLMKTGLGNPIINIESWNLNTDQITHEFETFNMEFAYLSNSSNIIEIKKANEVLRKY